MAYMLLYTLPRQVPNLVNRFVHKTNTILSMDVKTHLPPSLYLFIYIEFVNTWIDTRWRSKGGT